jgi:hypothetical protein
LTSFPLDMSIPMTINPPGAARKTTRVMLTCWQAQTIKVYQSNSKYPCKYPHKIVSHTCVSTRAEN